MTSTIRTTVLVLTGIIAMLLISSGYQDGPSPSSTIGNREVPTLDCEEDEVIGFDSSKPAPYPIACVHIDVIGS